MSYRSYIVTLGHVCVIALLVNSTVGCAKKKPTWPPRMGRLDREAATIPPGTKVSYKKSITDMQLGGHMSGNFEFHSDSNNPGKVSGTVISTLGPVKRTAHFGCMGWVYLDSTKEKRFLPGTCLTSGEIIVPRSDLLKTQRIGYVENSYECEDLGEEYIVIRLIPAKGHMLMWGMPFDTHSCANTGTQAEVAGEVVMRREDGWYWGDEKLEP